MKKKKGREKAEVGRYREDTKGSTCVTSKGGNRTGIIASSRGSSRESARARASQARGRRGKEKGKTKQSPTAGAGTTIVRRCLPKGKRMASQRTKRARKVQSTKANSVLFIKRFDKWVRQHTVAFHGQAFGLHLGFYLGAAVIPWLQFPTFDFDHVEEAYIIWFRLLVIKYLVSLPSTCLMVVEDPRHC